MSHPWMPLYISDYLGDTRRLKTLEHGAYMLLIMEYWQQGSLPNEDVELADIAGLCLDEWMAMKARISRLFKDGWKHKRIDSELAKAGEISEKRRASAGRRWSKSNAIAEQKDVTCNARAGVPQPQSHTEANASDAGASNHEPSIKPAYSDAKHELWGEGKVMLADLGISNSKAGSLMGRWMRDSRDDAAGVLDAIRRARDAKPVDPVAWITRAIIPAEKPNGQDRSASAAAKRLQASLARLGDPPPAMLPAPNSRGPGEDTNRLISQG